MQAIIPQTAAVRDRVSALFVERGAEVEALISAWLAPMDRTEAEDLAQDVWLAVWELAAAGGSLADPCGLLRDMCGRVVSRFYSRMAAEVASAAAVEAVAA